MNDRTCMLFALSALLGCNAPATEQVAPAAAESAGSAAASEAAASSATPSGEDEADASEPSEAATSAPDTWSRCSGDEERLVREFPVVFDGEITTIGARLDSGGLSAAYEFLGADGVFGGRWVCRAQGEGVEVQLQATLAGLIVGPIWSFDSLDAGADGRPPTPAPQDLSASALAGTWAATPGDAEAALATFARCTAPNGKWLTSGAFVALQQAGDVLDPDTIRWLAVPRLSSPSGDRYEVALSWTIDDEVSTASWFVTPGTEGCQPLDERAEEIVGFSDGIPLRRAATISPPNLRPSDAPFDEPDPGRRALLYVAAERRELATLEDWVGFIARLAPFEAGEWTARRAADAGVFDVAFAFGTGDERRELGWTVNTTTGAVEPTTRLASLVRAAQPRRLPGVEGPELLPTRLNEAALDAPVAPTVQALAQCLRDVRQGTATVRWSVQWDGHPFGVAVDEAQADSRLSRCVTAVAEAWRFERFAGPAMEASTVVTLQP